MKVRNLIKLLPVLMLGIALTGNALAGDHKNYHKTIKAEKVITIRPANFGPGTNFEFNEESIRDLEQLISRISEVRVVFENEGAPEILVSLKPNDEAGLEEWMFEQDYLSEERTPDIEAWMTDTNYISTETAPVESWMLDDDYFESEAVLLEQWMLEDDYLESEAAPVEPWMLESVYLETGSQGIESWMADPDYLQPESCGIESWMSDTGYLK